ncbi:MAG: quinone-dependent dihydroorotate dehydrogenase, partial [Proteobacteria bacterium]
MWTLIRRFLFRFDAEQVHSFTMRISKWLCSFALGRQVVRISVGGVPNPPIDVFSPSRALQFRNRIGLAAGFDKNASYLQALAQFGFGFAEIGTVTPRPQVGNPQPRLFRNANDRTVFNRMGFNNAGSIVVAENLRHAREQEGLPADFRIGVNIGKNKDTANEDAEADYALAIRPFEGLCDYVVINVSSPNTPGLRALQSVESLSKIVSGVQQTIGSWKYSPPVFLKLAPELENESLFEILACEEKFGLEGWVLTNTWGGKWSDGIAGGFSGSILTERSRDRLIEARSRSKKTLISVGGIMDEQEALKRITLGADLIQIYSGWIFGGPGLPARIART